MKKEVLKKVAIVLIILSMIMILVVFYQVMNYKKELEKEAESIRNKYLNGVVELSTDNKLTNIYGILRTYEEYIDFLNQNNLQNSQSDITKTSFEENAYLYYVLNVDECKENIKISDIEIKRNIAKLTFDVEIHCDTCETKSKIYLGPINKNENILEITPNYKYISEEKCSNIHDIHLDKPILYLYPQEETKVTIEIKYKDRIMTSYPKYDNFWKVIAHPNGDLYDKFGQYYYALYWDEQSKSNIDFSEGFYVDEENAISFLEEKLSIIGLNPKERNEFIMYWLPKLENNKKSIVYFELTEERQKNNQLIITPKPDSLLRINMHIKKANKKQEIKEQKLPTFERKGFVAVEWGGTIHS